MHASIRTYTGTPGLGRRLVQNRKEVERTVQKAQGFVGYFLVETPDGAVSVTLCRSREGTEESVRLASTWMKQNLPDLAKNPPEVASGEVLIDLTPVSTSR